MILLALLAAPAVPAPAQVKTFDVPGGNPYVTYSSAPFGKVFCRYQQIHDGRDIKVGPATLRSIAFNPNANGNATAHKLDMEIRVGHAIKAPSVMSPVYANNTAGTLPAYVKRAQISIPALPASSFAVKFPFARPFQYDGRSSLAFEVRVYGNDNNNQNFYYDLDLARSPYASYVSTVKGATATQGSLSKGWGLLARFEYGLATFTPFGMGCKGEGGYIPAINNTGLPRVGQPFQVYLANATGNRNAWLLVGKDKSKWGALSLPFDLTPLGFPGCRIYTDVVQVVPTITQGGGSGQGYGVLPINVPPYPILIGAKVYFQWAVAVPQGATNFTLAFSDAGEARIDI
jgi:hypothetical protein